MGVARPDQVQVRMEDEDPLHAAQERHRRLFLLYDCNKHDNYGHDACPQKLLRVEEVEASVLGFVSGLLKDPDRLRVGMQALIENERGQLRGDLLREAFV